MVYTIKNLLENEHNNTKAPANLKQNVFCSIEYLDVVKILLEFFIIIPIIVIQDIA